MALESMANPGDQFEDTLRMRMDRPTHEQETFERARLCF
jgi:hypothetical protein